MPISRYEIRNEYSLADSEVFREADKDDPEALLEGVSMAGLVGLLRQLGDLAEFAAKIFHNLHEEVSATAARGHGLMSRVQQLETEIPSIEIAFLSQTDHSSFFYHAGVDWHPNLQLNQNLITHENLPGFIMDSYEESRAPPRLFLLDKFDVAGAGACLKRYTDPLFFKVETSEKIGVDVQTEKKIRKGKKKGPHRRNGGTTEVLTTSHSKLHQLFLEERAENGVRNPSHRVKLKRRLNGFPFDLKAGKSYMEKLLKSPSPDHEVLREVTLNSSLKTSITNDHKEFGFEIFEARRSPPPSPYGEENVLNPSMYAPINDELLEAPNSYPRTTLEKVVSVDAQSHIEDSLTGYQSDDIASEIDNYVDAPSSIESEMDGDSESKVKSGLTSSIIKSESLFSDADEEHIRTRSTDSQPADEGNYSSAKQMSSFPSDSPTTSAEKPQTKRNSAEVFQYIDVHVNEMVANEDFQVDHQSRPVVPDNTCTVTDAVNHQSSELEQSMSSLCSNGSRPAISQSALEDVRKYTLKAPESDEMVFAINDEEEKANLALDPPRSPSLCDSESRSRDDSSGYSDGEYLEDKPNDESPPCVSTEPEIYYHTTDSSLKDALDGKHSASTLSVLNDLSTIATPGTISSKNQILDKLENEVPKVPENSSDYPATVHNGHGIESDVSKEDNLVDGLYDEDSNGSTDSPSHFPSIMEGSSYGSTDSIVENNHSNSSIDDQSSSELSDLAKSSDRPTEGLDAHAGDVIPEEPTKKETLALETLELSEVVGSQGIGLTNHVFFNDSEAPESSCCIPEDLEEPKGTEEQDTVEMDRISVDLISVNNCDADKSILTGVPEIYDNESLSKLVEEHDNCFEDSGTDALENDDNCPSECHGESDIVEKVSPTEAPASGFEKDFCNSVNDDHPKSELSGIFPNSDLVLEVDYGPKMEQCGVDKDQELFNQSGPENHAPDPEESIAPEKVGLPLSQLDQELVHPGGTSSDLSYLLPINNQTMLDHAISPPNNPFSETNQMNLPNLPPLPPVEWMMGKLQRTLSSIEEETASKEEQKGATESAPTASPNVINSSLEVEEKINHTLAEIYPETASKEENVENSSCNLEASTLHQTKIENEQQQFVIPISKGVSTSEAEEDGAKNGNRTVKLQWPRNPLIEDVAVLNKSKLRKVTERVLPEIQKVDERDSFLDQIRTKSFNLRPAAASRPSIRGPSTNLQVAAILEKANSIRQAFAGSDEDDSDSWSD